MLIHVHLRFNAKVSNTKEKKYLKDINMDELHGILTTYGMRTRKEKSILKELTIKKNEINPVIITSMNQILKKLILWEIWREENVNI